MAYVTKKDLEEAIDRVIKLCDSWERTNIHLPGDPKKIPIAPIPQIREAIQDVTVPRCSKCHQIIEQNKEY